MPISRRTAGVALACFVLLGLPAGALGVAWPSMRGSFGLPLAALGGLLLPATVAYLLFGAASGHLIGRLGLKRVLVGSVSGFVVGLAAIAISPLWWLLLVGNTAVSMGGGALDATLNSFAATNQARRLLGLLHGAYSAGGALGPILVAGVVTAGVTWRAAYVVLAAAALALSIVVSMVGGWRLPTLQNQANRSPGAARPRAEQRGLGRSRILPRRLWPVLALSLGAFFVYTGTEISAGQWAYTFLTGARGMDVALAAAAVSGFWWGQTLVRAVSGFISVRLGADVLIDVSLAAALLGAAALWWVHNPGVQLAALVLFGGGLGPLFPTLISLAPALFGGRAVEVVGYQVAAAAVGGTAIVALTGVALQQLGLFLLPATLFAGVAATLVFHHAGRWLAARPAHGGIGQEGVEPADP